MNLFRFLGDLSHLLAIILLLLKIWKSRSCAGISGKSQVLFAVVFTARYLDLFTNYISLYNTCMKVVYIACSFTTVWMIYSKFKATYDGNHDTFRVEFLVVPTAVLAFLVNHDFTPLEVGFCWDRRGWVAGAADSRPSQVFPRQGFLRLPHAGATDMLSLGPWRQIIPCAAALCS
ncbi:ER lumen protein-retaining receptor 1-like [Peromyscus eremicus]|uniref:ER lumen protein-retaining receptor 1-like n=1 Tax=Peromyscus eremicus TaxID=42410 RepID=UPI0027DD2575|nr:ER lumen protein-retaining receptor 1-like [Peromyscus eremicus]